MRAAQPAARAAAAQDGPMWPSSTRARVFQSTGRGGGFDRAKRTLGRRIKTDGRDALGQLEAQAGVRRRGALLAQAQVAAWVRPVRARTAGPSRFQRVLGRAGLK